MRYVTLLLTLALALSATPARPRDASDARMARPTGQVSGARAHLQPASSFGLLRADTEFGPFVVVDRTRARLRGITDARSPQAFAAMLRRYPRLEVLEMRLCQGTVDDQANLQLGRMIRASGITTYIPDRGFVGSGAVELFLAGRRRLAAPSASCGVHSWRDESGREPSDYRADAPANRPYIDFYRAMGMNDRAARSFYAMTNSVPFAGARLSAAQMQGWVDLELSRGGPDDERRTADPF